MAKAWSSPLGRCWFCQPRPLEVQFPFERIPLQRSETMKYTVREFFLTTWEKATNLVLFVRQPRDVGIVVGSKSLKARNYSRRAWNLSRTQKRTASDTGKKHGWMRTKVQLARTLSPVTRCSNQVTSALGYDPAEPTTLEPKTQRVLH